MRLEKIPHDTALEILHDAIAEQSVLQQLEVGMLTVSEITDKDGKNKILIDSSSGCVLIS